MLRWAQRALVACLVLAPLHGAAQPCIPCLEDQHEGFYMRLSVGMTRSVTYGEGPSGAEIGGASSIALGLFVVPNLAIAIDLFSSGGYGMELQPTPTLPTRSWDVQALAAGIGLTYYLPLDFYLSLAPGLGLIRISAQGVKPEFSPVTLGVDAIVGKEWWLGGSWAMGAGAQVIYVGGAAAPQGISSVLSVGVLFTVTKN
jgi:hypothetical protein